MLKSTVVLPALVATVFAGCSSSSHRRVADRMMAKPAPAFELEALDGSTVGLAQFRGRPVIVAFFAYG